MTKKGTIWIIFALTLFCSGCRLTYLLHAASGQLQLVSAAIPIEEALNKGVLTPPQQNRLRLVARIKDFGEKELGLRNTRNYETVYLRSGQPPIYTLSASPKDRLTRKTWWFPFVGDMPYLGFFDLESAKQERNRLTGENLDVSIGISDAYSTLGWFQDPVTLNLLEGSTPDLVETILHEMTHTTLYLKGQGAFNEGLALVVGKVGSVLFLEDVFGPDHPFTEEAKRSIEDERLFSEFLASLMDQLELLYSSPKSYQEKLDLREKVFAGSLEAFKHLKEKFGTDHFDNFGRMPLNNAYILSVGLYHRDFHLFEAVLKKKGGSIKDMLAFFKEWNPALLFGLPVKP
ncbi:MAG: aminopeptidase [Proteobacteria bacterium]|nr:aminopeptidase [Pseudomonadota bacterium]MBU1904943.1 aminopeptidase [Pseudomonadota bacterium]